MMRFTFRATLPVLGQGARVSKAQRARSSRASHGTTSRLRPFFAGGAGLLGACSHFSDTLLVVLFFTSLAPRAFAQAPAAGTLRVTVVDPSGAVIVGATVAVTGSETGTGAAEIGSVKK